MDAIPFNARRFRSTAEYYARYRVPYPPALIAAVARRVGLAPGDRVLDLGCGPAMLAIGFAELGMAAIAMDPEPDMLAAAGEAASAAGVEIELRQGSSYDLTADLGPFRLVVMGRSFHWMDRPATLGMLEQLIPANGAIALFHDRRINATPDWQKVLNAASEAFAPERQDRRNLHHSPDWQPHEVMLLASTFSSVETIGRIFWQELEVDDILGRAYSMSVTSLDALGGRQPDFESRVRTELAALAPDGRFSEIVGVDAMLAFRPGEAGAA